MRKSGSFDPWLSAERQRWSPLRRMGRNFWEHPDTYFRGRWEQRHELNVPGPFFGAETDTCCDGPPYAPASLMVDDLGLGFVWRQPRDDAETLALMTGCSSDPYGGFGRSGDVAWTPDLVRDWWGRRAAREEQAAAAARYAIELGRPDQAAAYLAYLVGDDLVRDLRRYLFFLVEHRYPTVEDLPEL